MLLHIALHRDYVMAHDAAVTALGQICLFHKDRINASEVVQLLASTPISNLDIHDPMRIQGLKAWGRLCKCLGHKFQPYLEVAIPCLLQSARFTLPDVATLKDQMKAMPEILKSSKAATDKRLLQKSPFEKLSSDIIPALVEALVKEEVIKISAVMLDSLEDCLELSGPVLNIDQIKCFLSVIMDVLDTSILIPEGNEASEQGEQVRKKACACLKIFMKTYKGSLLQFFDQLLSPMEHMWVKDKTVKERKIALKILTDVVEEFREEALKFCESELLLLFKACSDDEPEVQEVVAMELVLLQPLVDLSSNPWLEKQFLL